MPKTTISHSSTAAGSRRASRAPSVAADHRRRRDDEHVRPVDRPEDGEHDHRDQPDSADRTFFSALIRAIDSSSTSPSAATSMTPSAAPK